MGEVLGGLMTLLGWVLLGAICVLALTVVVAGLIDRGVNGE